jgi:hypothetical protein
MNKKILIACIALLLLILVLGCTGIDKCGEGLICETGETIEKCLSKNGCSPTECTNECGNGTCEYKMCKTLPCPCLETQQSCPQDCSKTKPPTSQLIEDSPFGLFTPLLFYGYGQYDSADADSVVDLNSYWTAIMTNDYPIYAGIANDPYIFPSLSVTKNVIDIENTNLKPYEFYYYVREIPSAFKDVAYWGIDSESDGIDGFVFVEPKKLAVYTRLAYRGLKDSNPKIKLFSSGTWGSPESYYDTPYNDVTQEGYYNLFFNELKYMESVEQQIANDGGTYEDYYDGRYDEYNFSHKDLELIFDSDKYSKYMDGQQISKFFMDLGGNKGIQSEWNDQIVPMQELFDKHGYVDLDLWVTQTGMQSAPFSLQVGQWSAPNIDREYSESKQAQSVPMIYSILLKDGVEKIFWASTYEMIWVNNPEHYFSKIGFIYNGLRNESKSVDLDDLGYGVKKLSYYSYKLMVEKLEGADWDNVDEIEVDEDYVRVYRFMKNGEPTFVAWWEYWEEPNAKSKSVNLQLGLAGDVKITTAVPHFENGLSLEKSGERFEELFDTEIKTIDNRAGILNLQLNHNPVYIENVDYDAELSNVPYSFYAVHFEIDPNAENAQDKWDDMEGMAELANQYNTPLTIMFWPGSAEYALSSPQRLAQVREWQAQGHEVGTHDQGCDDTDPLTKENFALYGPEDNAKYIDLAGDYEIQSGTSAPCEWMIDSFKYFAGGRFDGRTSLALKYTLENNLTVYRSHIRAGYFEMYPTGGTQVKIETYNTLNSNEIYGAVNHGEGIHNDGPNGYDELITWFEFLYEKDPTGEKRLTLSDLMENYVIPNNRYITWEQIQNQTTPEITECSVFLDTTQLIPQWYSETKLFNFGRCLNTRTYCKHEKTWCHDMGNRGIIYLPRDCEDVSITNFVDFDYCETTTKTTCGNGTCDKATENSKNCPTDCIILK